MAKRIKGADEIRFGNQVIFDRETISGNPAWTNVITNVISVPFKGEEGSIRGTIWKNAAWQGLDPVWLVLKMEEEGHEPKNVGSLQNGKDNK